MFKKDELKNLWPFYTHSLLLNLSKVIMPFYVLYFLSIGFSFFQIALIATVRSIVTLIFEVPTGAIADIYGRKTSVILGYFMMSVSVAAVILTKNFYLLAAIFAMNALFETLVSGADDAWAVDLAEKDNSNLTDSYFLKKRAFRNIGMVIAPLVAGLVVKHYGMTNLWLIYGMGIFIATLFLIFAKNTNHVEIKENEIEDYKNVFTHSRKTWDFIRKHKIISLLFAAIFIFFVVEEITSLIWTPYLQSHGLPLPQIGYLFSLIAGLGILTPLITERLLKNKSKLSILTATTLTYAVALILAGVYSRLLFISIIFVITYSMEEIIEPLEDSVLNKYLRSEIRATALSLKSVITSMASIIGGPLAGYILGILSADKALMFSGLLFMVIPLVYSLAGKRAR